MTYSVNLRNIEYEVGKQEQDIREHLLNLLNITNNNEQLVVRMKSVRASVELLREEIEELHQVMMTLFKDNKSINDSGNKK